MTKKENSERDEFIKKRVKQCKKCFGKGTRGYNILTEQDQICKCYYNAVKAWNKFHRSDK